MWNYLSPILAKLLETYQQWKHRPHSARESTADFFIIFALGCITSMKNGSEWELRGSHQIKMNIFKYSNNSALESDNRSLRPHYLSSAKFIGRAIIPAELHCFCSACRFSSSRHVIEFHDAQWKLQHFQGLWDRRSTIILAMWQLHWQKHTTVLRPFPALHVWANLATVSG